MQEPIAAGNMQKSVIQKTTNVNSTLFYTVECVIEIDRSSIQAYME